MPTAPQRRAISLLTAVEYDFPRDPVVLGYDPSLSGPGWAVVQGGAVLGYGKIESKGSKYTHQQQFERAFLGVLDAVETYRPDVAVFEDVNCGRDHAGTRAVGIATGAGYAAIMGFIEIQFLLNIATIKMSAGIDPKTDRDIAKREMVEHVNRTHGLDLIFEEGGDDIADAIQIAILGEATINCYHDLAKACGEHMEDLESRAAYKDLLEFFKEYESRSFLCRAALSSVDGNGITKHLSKQLRDRAYRKTKEVTS